MEITELFKNSLKYPTKDWGKLLLLGALLFGVSLIVLLAGFSVIFGQIAIVGILSIVALIVYIIVILFYEGYVLSIIKETINNKNFIGSEKDILPEFKWSENIIDGIKVLVLSIVYMIIPAVIGLVLAYALGVFSDIATITQLFNYSSLGVNTDFPLAMSNSLLTNVQTNIYIVYSVSLILSIAFSLFATIALGRLAETDRLGSMFEFSDIINTISKIGWGNYIVWFILLNIIGILIAVVAAVVFFIPIIGIIAYVLLIPPFLLIFQARATGLIYNQSKE